METINSIEELKQLAKGEKFYVVTDRCNGYWVVDIHPKTDFYLVTIWDANYSTPKCFSRNDFVTGNVFLKGKYNGKEVGQIMINNLMEQSERIKEIYIKEGS